MSSSDVSLSLFGYDQYVSATCKVRQKSEFMSKTGFKTLRLLPAEALGRAVVSPTAEQPRGEQ